VNLLTREALQVHEGYTEAVEAAVEQRRRPGQVLTVWSYEPEIRDGVLQP
jgi:hypothetical protein